MRPLVSNRDVTANVTDSIDVNRFDTHTDVLLNRGLVARRIEATRQIEWFLGPHQLHQATWITRLVEQTLAQVPRNRAPNRHERRRQKRLKRKR